MSAPTTAFWLAHYDEVHRGSHAWLDYSNERVQGQSLSLALEALGSIEGRRCLDVGAGRGQLAKMLSALGASHVTAIELVENTVRKLRAEAPQIEWRAGDAGDARSYAGLGGFDVVAAVEVLQYVPFAPTLELLFSLLRPGGRLVGVIPNRACPMVRRPIERYEGRFGAVSSEELAGVLGVLPGLLLWRHKGLHFADDQRLLPYEVSAWSGQAGGLSGVPNRFVFVALREGAMGEASVSQE
jgi:SAM-dependent methyltransferase